MPKLYNIPEWFSGQYEARMDELNLAIDQVFSRAPFVDHAYIQELKTRDLPWETHLIEFLEGTFPPCWDGPERNLGELDIRTTNCYALHRMLPTYLSDCITVRDNGTSLAEIGEMPLILAGIFARPRPKQNPVGQDFEKRISCFFLDELRVIRSVLDLMATRTDREGEEARLALTELWPDIEPC